MYVSSVKKILDHMNEPKTSHSIRNTLGREISRNMCTYWYVWVNWRSRNYAEGSSTCCWMLRRWCCVDELKPCFLKPSKTLFWFDSAARWEYWHTQWLTRNDMHTALVYFYTINCSPYALCCPRSVQRDVNVFDECCSRALTLKQHTRWENGKKQHRN